MLQFYPFGYPDMPNYRLCVVYHIVDHVYLLSYSTSAVSKETNFFYIFNFKLT